MNVSAITNVTAEYVTKIQADWPQCQMLHTPSPDAILPRPVLANKAVLAMFIGTFAGFTLGAKHDPPSLCATNNHHVHTGTATQSTAHCLPTPSTAMLCGLVNISYTHRGHAAGGAVGLRHCATSRKVASSIPDGVIGIFQ